MENKKLIIILLSILVLILVLFFVHSKITNDILQRDNPESQYFTGISSIDGKPIGDRLLRPGESALFPGGSRITYVPD